MSLVMGCNLLGDGACEWIVLLKGSWPLKAVEWSLFQSLLKTSLFKQ